MKKLQTSGYDLMYRLEILKSILNGWKKILEKAETGERPLHSIGLENSKKTKECKKNLKRS